MVRKCTKCNKDKALTEFYAKGGKNSTPHAYCKECSSSDTLERQRKIKTRAVLYKGGCCNICGYKKYEGALEFHHINPTEKDFSVSNCRIGRWDKIKSELDKCVCLCANCHREIHKGIVSTLDIRPEYSISIEIGTSTKKKSKRCLDCSAVLKTAQALRCTSCASKLKQPKIIWPSVKELLTRLQTSNYSKLGRELGVSDNAIRKHLKAHSQLPSVSGGPAET